MKRYAESKAKVQMLEQASSDKVSDAGKTIQSKESELLSLRLKIDNFERTSASQKDEIEDLKDKGKEYIYSFREVNYYIITIPIRLS